VIEDDPMAPEANHIAFYLPSLRGGGAEKVMLNLAREFSNRGYTVDLVLVDAYGEYLKDVPEEITVIDLNSRRFLFALPKLVRYLNQSEPDVLLSTIDTANITAICAARLANVSPRVFIRISNTISTKEENGELKHRLVHEVAKRVYSHADGIVAVSDGVATDLQETMGLPSELITTIYNPSVTPELLELREESVDHPWFDEDVPVILGVGEFTVQKDFTTLIRAFSIVLREYDARLVLLGKGPKQKQIEQVINELGLSESVWLPGFVDNPYAYMANADVFVLSSRWEGCPNVLIEALACGAPVVSTDCPNGPREILEGKKWGELVPVADDSKLADGIKKAMAKPERESGYESYAENNFSIKSITATYQNTLFKS